MWLKLFRNTPTNTIICSNALSFQECPVSGFMGRDKEGFNEKWICNTQVFPKFICPLLLIIIYLNISLFLIGWNLPANSTKHVARTIR